MGGGNAQSDVSIYPLLSRQDRPLHKMHAPVARRNADNVGDLCRCNDGLAWRVGRLRFRSDSCCADRIVGFAYRRICGESHGGGAHRRAYLQRVTEYR